MSVTGEPDGNPVKCGIPIGDLSAGLFCAVAILSRAARARAHRPRPVHRHLAVRGRAGALDLGDGGAVGDRPRAGQARLRAPADRALPGAAARPTATSPWAATRRRCSSGCATALGRPRARRRPALRHQRRPHGQRRRAGRGARGRRSPRAAPTSGSPRWSRAASRAGRSTTTPRSSPTRTPRRARWRSSLDHPVEGTIQRARHPGEAVRHARRDPAPGAAARPAHGGDPARGRLRGGGDRCADAEPVSSAAARRSWVTFNRPEAHNAMTFAMYEDALRGVRGRRRRRRRPRDGAARRGREGVRGRHRHPPVRRLRRVGRRRARLRGDDRPHRRPARDGAQADRGARRRLRDGLAASRSRPPATCASARPPRASASRSPARSATACRWRTTPASRPCSARRG